jgi:FtsX-like permease family
MHLGRAWNERYRDLGEAESYVSASLLQRLSVNGARGERVEVALPSDYADALLNGAVELDGGALTPSGFDAMLQSMADGAAVSLLPDDAAADDGGAMLTLERRLLASSLYSTMSALVEVRGDGRLHLLVPLSVELTVVDGIDDPLGKWPPALGDVVAVDAAHVKQLAKRAMFVAAGNPALSTRVINALGAAAIDGESFDIDARLDAARVEEHAQMVVGTLRRESRAGQYLLDGAQFSRAFVHLADWLQTRLAPLDGIGAVDVQLPLAAAMRGMEQIRLYLTQIFAVVLVVLVVLGIVLVFQLVGAEAEARGFEYGVLRSLGLRHSALAGLLVGQALLYALPALVGALLLSSALNVPVQLALANFALVPPTLALSGASVALVAALALLMPLVANVQPIVEALARPLVSALSVYRQHDEGAAVKRISLHRYGVSSSQAALSAFSVLVGFTVYYVVPYSFVNLMWPLFFTLLNMVLLGMLAGLCLLASLAQPYVELAVLRTLLACYTHIYVPLLTRRWRCRRRRAAPRSERRDAIRSASMRALVAKALHAHRPRNWMTALMFLLLVAVVLFSAVMLNVQIRGLQDNIRQTEGADLHVTARRTPPLDEAALGEALGDAVRAGDVRDFAFLSYPLDIEPEQSDNYVAPLGVDYANRVVVRAATASYLRATDTRYLAVDHVDSAVHFERLPDGKPDVVRALYSSDDGGGEQADDRRWASDAGALLSGPMTSTASGVAPSCCVGNDAATLTLPSEMSAPLSVDMVCAQKMLDDIGVDDLRSPSLQFVVRRSPFGGAAGDLLYRARCVASLSQVPGSWRISRYRPWNSLTLISQDDYQRLHADVHVLLERSSYDARRHGLVGHGGSLARMPSLPPSPRQEMLKISLRNELPEHRRRAVKSAIYSVLDSSQSLVDVIALVAGTDQARSIVLLLLGAIYVLACSLCAFILWSAIARNVRENLWESAVLRSIGLTRNDIVALYVVESLCIVLSALLLGTIVGMSVAATLALQFSSILELPFFLPFPWPLYALIVAISLSASILSAVLPTRHLMKSTIATLFQR